jgi:putative transposase
MEYRRVYILGGTYFFTLVTFQRKPIFSEPLAIELLRSAIAYTEKRMPFQIDAMVILPDHLHCIWSLPPSASDYSTRWRLIKSKFSHDWNSNKESDLASRQKKGEVDTWQRRFWEHLIRDENDLNDHIDYIHYNPVKHGLATEPSMWEYSSFHKYVNEGILPIDWGRIDKIWPGNDMME